VNLIALALIGGGAYWAYRQGHLDEIIGDILAEWSPIADTPAEPALGVLEAPPVGVIAPPALPVVVPSATVEEAPDPRAGMTPEESYLQTYIGYVSPFAKNHLELAAAIMKQETGHLSGRARERARSPADAYGLMQVKVGTAQHMRNLGYTRLPATVETLKTPAGSIYFGTAYMAYLGGIKKTRTWEWFIRAYNGGPGDNNPTDGIIAHTHRYAGGGKNAENDGYFRRVSRFWNENLKRNGKPEIRSFTT